MGAKLRRSPVVRPPGAWRSSSSSKSQRLSASSSARPCGSIYLNGEFSESYLNSRIGTSTLADGKRRRTASIWSRNTFCLTRPERLRKEVSSEGCVPSACPGYARSSRE